MAVVALLMDKVSSWHTWLRGLAAAAMSVVVGEALSLRGCSLGMVLWELLWRQSGWVHRQMLGRGKQC